MTIDTKRLRALAEKATPGPWHIDHEDGSSEFGDYIVYGIEGVCDVDWVTDGAPAFAYTEGMSYADAEFIAATDPQTVLALVAEVERLRDIIERVDDVLVRHYLDMSVATDLLPILAEADLT